MATFPTLTTGAVAQYSLPQIVEHGAEVIRFLDGSDQRFLTQGRTFRKWQIRLNLLTETEMQAVESFFESQLGEYSSFSFPDPISGTTVSNCKLGNPELLTEYLGTDAGSTSIWVVETNG